MAHYRLLLFFFFNDTATTEIYTLSLHDALPICREIRGGGGQVLLMRQLALLDGVLEGLHPIAARSEEHTSELQSQSNLVCRLLLEKKKKQRKLRLAQIRSTETGPELIQLRPDGT